MSRLSQPAIRPTGRLQAPDSPDLSPRVTTRGEAPPDSDSPAGAPVPVRTDYLTVTAPVPSGDVDVRASLIAIVAAGSGGAFGDPEDTGRGMLGYERCVRWSHGGAVACWGGQRDTVMISLPGDACSLVEDWPRLVASLRDALGGRITRWDGAADDYDGAHGVDDAARAWVSGLWASGGRPPRASQAGNWLVPDGRGRTLYVGSRQSGKLARVYEKGLQMRDPRRSWVRWEVELHRVSREIPWDAVLDPRPYIAGAYPSMAWVADGGATARIPTHRRRDPVSLDHLVEHAVRSYGRLVGLLEARGVPCDDIVSMLRRDGVPERLRTDELVRLRDRDGWTSDPAPAWLLWLMQRQANRSGSSPVVRLDE